MSADLRDQQKVSVSLTLLDWTNCVVSIDVEAVGEL